MTCRLFVAERHNNDSLELLHARKALMQCWLLSCGRSVQVLLSIAPVAARSEEVTLEYPSVDLIMAPEAALPLASALASWGATVGLSLSAAEAERAWRSAGPPDLVFLDTATPGIAEVLGSLRHLAELSLLIGVYPEDALADALERMRDGFYDCVPAPLSPERAVALAQQASAARRDYLALFASQARATEPIDTARLLGIARAARALHHDLRNPLCAIGLHAQLLRMALKGAEPRLLSRIDSIETAIGRIQELLETLKAATEGITTTHPQAPSTALHT